MATVQAVWPGQPESLAALKDVAEVFCGAGCFLGELHSFPILRAMRVPPVTQRH